MSTDGSPSCIHSATRRPNPPAWVTHTASQSQKPRTVADSPTIEPASGVNENIPLIDASGSAGRIRPFSAGSRRAASASATSKSRGVNGISDGINASSPGRRSSACGVAIGSCL